MILLFEKNNEYQVFEDPFQDAQYSYLLANKNFHTGELAHNFEAFLGINMNSLRAL